MSTESAVRYNGYKTRAGEGMEKSTKFSFFAACSKCAPLSRVSALPFKCPACETHVKVSAGRAVGVNTSFGLDASDFQCTISLSVHSRARTRLEYSAHPRISHSLRTHCAVVSSLCIPQVPCEPLNVYCCRFSLFSVQIISNYVYNLSSCSSNSVSALQNGLIIHTNTYIHIYIYICINVCARVYV